MSLSTPTQSQHTASQPNSSSVFQLKGGLYTLTSLQLLSNDLSALAEQLDIKLQQAPKFFHNAPVVIDLIKIGSADNNINFKQLKEILSSRHLIPVGIKGGNSEQHNSALAQGFALLSETSKEKEVQKTHTNTSASSSTASSSSQSSQNSSYPNSLEEDPDEAIQGSNTRIITEPVRSGQQIYVRGGDLLVLAPVSHGAELLADGHIHIYGPLRGRALAGVTGDIHARIFCQSLEAELISIAGQYKISEDFEKDAWQRAVDIHLLEGRLQIREL